MNMRRRSPAGTRCGWLHRDAGRWPSPLTPSWLAWFYCRSCYGWATIEPGTGRSGSVDSSPGGVFALSGVGMGLLYINMDGRRVVQAVVHRAVTRHRHQCRDLVLGYVGR